MASTLKQPLGATTVSKLTSSQFPFEVQRQHMKHAQDLNMMYIAIGVFSVWVIGFLPRVARSRAIPRNTNPKAYGGVSLAINTERYLQFVFCCLCLDFANIIVDLLV